MKLITRLLFAGVLFECIAFMIASPLDKTLLTKSSQESQVQRSKREPGVALVLSIIDKNSPKIKKLEIGMDDYDCNEKNRRKISSKAGKKLIHKLLRKGDVELKSDFDEDDVREHKLEELLEILKDASELKHRVEDRHSCKSQKNGRKSHSHDCDGCKLEKFLKLLEHLKNREHDLDSSEEDSRNKNNGVKRRPKPNHSEHSEENISEDESDSENTEEDISVEDDSSEEDSKKKSNGVKRRSKPDHFDRSEHGDEDDEEHIDNDDKDHNQGSIKRRPKPDHVESESSEEKNNNDVKRRPKPEHVDHSDRSDEEIDEDDNESNNTTEENTSEDDDSSEEDSERNNNSVKRKPKPDHFDHSEHSDEEPEHNEDDEKRNQGSAKRKSKPDHVEMESSEEKNSNSVKRRPKPDHLKHSDEDEDDNESNNTTEEDISDDDDSSEGDSEKKNNSAKRKSKPDHFDHSEEIDDDDEKRNQGSVKRRSKPDHLKLDSSVEDSKKNRNGVKRRPKPVHFNHSKHNDEEPEHNEDDEKHQESVKRRPKPDRVEKENSEEKNSNDVKRRGKPNHVDHSEESEEEIVEDDSESNSTEEDDSSDEPDSKQCADDLDEEQLLQGISFIQTQLKRFLGVECTCNPTENTVLKECPLHKKSSMRHRRNDRKERVLKVRSSEEHNKKVLENKKFTKKASLKDLKKGKIQSKKFNKKDDLSTANTFTKTSVHQLPEKPSETTTEGIMKLLEQLGLSPKIVTKTTSKMTNAEKPSKVADPANEDLQFFRNEPSLHRSSSNSKSSDKKNQRKLRNRRKGRSHSDTSASTKRTQRDINSEEIAAEQEEQTLYNSNSEANEEPPAFLSRSMEKSPEHIIDSEVESLKSVFDEYKERVADIKQKENVHNEQIVATSDDHHLPHASTIEHSPEVSEVTESVERILKEISFDDGDYYTDPDLDNPPSSKEYVIANESDSSYRPLYNKFANLLRAVKSETTDGDSETV